MYVPNPSSRRVQLRVAALVAAAWLLVTGLVAARAAAVVPPLLLLATASLLRGGRSLLDRLMLAAAVLLGATCAAGLGFSVWPWGLHPVAVAGTAATALILLAAASGRRPSLPRPRWSDAVALAAAGVVGLVAAWPVWHAGADRRLAIMLDGEDLGRHAAVFDAIRRTGGYLFADHARAEHYVYGGMIDYPQGSHLLAGLLDGFVRSSGSDFGSGTAMLTHYLWFTIAGYTFLALALVWAAQWIAAGALTPARRLPLAALVAAVCAAGEMLELLSFGYPSQVLGLAEAVLLLALLVRPLPRVRDQLLLVAALLTAVGFTYYLYLPPVGLAALIWLGTHWRRAARRPVALALAALCGVAAAAPMAYGLLFADQAGALFTIGYLVLSRDALAALAALVATGLLTRRGRHSRIWRRYALAFVPVAAFAGVLLAGQRMYGVGSGYYANKALYLVFALLLVGAGAVALHLPPPAVSRRHRSLPAAVPALVAIVALTGAGRGDTPYQPQPGGSWGRAWLTGPVAARTDQARLLLRAAARLPDDAPVLVVGDDTGYESYRMTLFLSTIQRTSGATAGAIYNHLPVTAPDRLDASVASMPGPVRLLALSDAAQERARAVCARHPAVRVEVVRV
ncbi:hypothetical protein ACQP2P_07705 [Dactylosporangium sp. CA-139114]|uniref:hypothetical protein n=1 Tax=Dactylosporangium sp. CA-139114 TaxID=3239931 RepID=UPI003D960A82